jgi:peptidoglycan/LPS O-acetylase OafA/YrhL
MDLLHSAHFSGILIGLCTFVIIGIFHPIVIKAEYYWGKHRWWIFLLGGLVCLAASYVIADTFYSPILGILGFTLLWSIKELYDQEERVRKGLYPKNPKRKYPF